MTQENDVHSGKRVLLVDDEEDLIYAVKPQLEKQGYLVTIAMDGQSALDVARRDRPDLIILDLMLPKVHGYMVCRMLKFDDKYKQIPIIVFTARAQEADEKMAYEVGADDFLIKPFDSAALFEKMEQCFQKTARQRPE